MQTKERITLVFPDMAQTELDWESSEREESVITVSNYNVLNGALHAGVQELGRDIERVIFDRSIDGDTYLTFLSSLPIEFRGDVLRIRKDGSGTLSASSPRGDGRFLYGLSLVDVGFYLRTVTRVGFCTLDRVEDLLGVGFSDEESKAPRFAPLVAV
ncbi:MAG TPA: hypothetical protein VMS12_12880 [Thermoanaerobaculia bacterium]|nr:hypothetical protein [Thermoanaerobaculia bacterium]